MGSLLSCGSRLPFRTENIGMLIASGAGEGVEETLESILNPFLQQMSYNQNAETFLQTPKLLADAAYEGWIGAILGVFGRGTNTAIDVVDNLIHNNIVPGEKLMEAAGVSEPEVLGAMAMNEMAQMEVAETTPDELLESYSIALNIGRSVGAKAKSYMAYNPLSGEDMPLTEGTRIVQPKNHVMAGKGRDRQIDEIDLLLDTYGGDPLEWTKEKGVGYVDDEYGDSHCVELHWYQEPSVGQAKMKIKVQPDGRIYLDED